MKKPLSLANQILKKGYNLNRNLTSGEIKAEATSLLRKHAKGNLDDMQERMFYQLEPSEWQIIVDFGG